MSYIIDESYASCAQDSRVQLLILHYTAMDFASSLERLTTGDVSAHYLVSDEPEPRVFQLVSEDRRAWHAGESAWGRRSNLNEGSIGVEIVNPGYRDGQWVGYSERQIEVVAALCLDIVDRHQIEPTRVLGHSDVAPLRKSDPGPMFPWKRLYSAGVGAWYDEHDKREAMLGQSDIGLPPVKMFQEWLFEYGYSVLETGVIDGFTTEATRAFQQHFRPSCCDGVLDLETWAIASALYVKYIQPTLFS